MRLFCLLLLFIAFSSIIQAKTPHQVLTGENTKIPIKLFEYYFPTIGPMPDQVLKTENLGIHHLKNAKWEREVWDDQSYVRGFWVKYQLLNRTDYEHFGLDHQNNFYKLIYVHEESSKITTVYESDIGKGVYDAITGDHLYDNIRISLPKGELVTVYSFVRSSPFNRWHGLQNPFERASIGEWDALVKDQVNSIVIKFMFSIFCWSLGLYLLIHLIIGFSKTYLWMTLLSFSTAFLFTFTETGMAFHMGLPKDLTISGFYTLVTAICIFSFNQFAYDILQNEFFSRRYQKLHYFFQGVVGLFAIVNLISLFFYPSSYELDLNENPIKQTALGPSMMPPILLVMIWIIYLAPLIYFAFLSTIKKRPNALYMFISIMVLALLPLKYVAIKYLPAGELLEVFMSNEAIIGVMFLMMATTASEKIKTTEQGLLQARILLRDAYSRFVPKELTDHLKKDSIINIELGDQEELELSILFSDIRDFTSISEKLSPEENFRFINDYLNKMVPLVKSNGGFVNKFVGDSIMALYDKSAEQAIDSAIEMCQILREYNEERREMGDRKPIKIGIGINTGRSMLGTLGDADRMEASVISNTVNVASRLESLTKEYRVPVLLSGDTVKNLPKNRYRTRWIDRVAVKGKKIVTDIHELIDAYADEDILLKQRTLPMFSKALDVYYDKDRERAKLLFQGVLDENPKDNVAQLYLERCEERRVSDRRAEA